MNVKLQGILATSLNRQKEELDTTDRQTDRQTDREIDKQTDIDRQTEQTRQTDGQTNIQNR